LKIKHYDENDSNVVLITLAGTKPLEKLKTNLIYGHLDKTAA